MNATHQTLSEVDLVKAMAAYHTRIFNEIIKPREERVIALRRSIEHYKQLACKRRKTR